MPHFALIDAARDDAIYNLLSREPGAESLFAGTLDPELARAAPYIVELRPESPFRDALQSYGWPRAWGITCHSTAERAATRRTLRRNMQAMLPSGRVGLFRFYDPRVWLPFISASQGAELDPWFDPITDYWAPHPRSGATLQISRNGATARITTEG